MILSILLIVILVGVLAVSVRAGFWSGAALIFATAGLQVATTVTLLQDGATANTSLLNAYMVASLALPPVAFFRGRDLSAKHSAEPERAERLREAADLMLLPWIFVLLQLLLSFSAWL